MKALLRVVVGVTIIAAISFLVAPLTDVVKDEVTLYNASSDGDLPSSREVFRVFPASQIVVHSLEPLPPRKLRNCTVRDRRNWRCEYSGDGKLVYAMIGGELKRDLDGQPVLSDYRYVSRLKWWSLTVREWLIARGVVKAP